MFVSENINSKPTKIVKLSKYDYITFGEGPFYNNILILKENVYIPGNIVLNIIRKNLLEIKEILKTTIVSYVRFYMTYSLKDKIENK